MARFFATSIKYDDGEDGFALRFDDVPVVRAVAQRFIRECTREPEFGEIDGEQLRAVAKRAGVRIARAGSRGDMDIFQAQSIFRHAVRQYNISNSWRIDNEGPAIDAEYARGASITEISRTHRLSPYAIFKHVIGASGRAKLAQLSTGGTHAVDVLGARDAEQYLIAQSYDFESVAVQLRMAEAADRREANFIRILHEDVGIELRTQEELFEEARKRGVKPITPDALFTSRVTINGKRAHWIDFKSYCGVDIPFIARKVEEQSAKYVRAFGPGAIVYEHGYVGTPPYWAVSARALRDVIDKGTRAEVLED